MLERMPTGGFEALKTGNKYKQGTVSHHDCPGDLNSCELQFCQGFIQNEHGNANNTYNRIVLWKMVILIHQSTSTSNPSPFVHAMTRAEHIGMHFCCMMNNIQRGKIQVTVKSWLITCQTDGFIRSWDWSLSLRKGQEETLPWRSGQYLLSNYFSLTPECVTLSASLHVTAGEK